MSIELVHNIAVAPSIDTVKLTYKQKFPEGGIKKNIMTFDREEDMIVMCLSTFVHDYVHDYNLGTMHARVIKGNIKRKNPDEPSLFESLGITIGNTIFKIFAYPTGGHRDISMYNDDQFEDEPSDGDTKKENFYTYLNKNEERIDEIPSGGALQLIETPTIGIDNIDNKPVIKTPLIKEINNDKVTEKLIIDVKPPLIEKAISKEDIPIKSITFSDLKDSLLIPSVIKDLNIEKIVSSFERNADFLDFHSSLNTYIVTYLGYDINKDDEFINDDVEDKNIIMNQAIRASFNYIINDFNINSDSLEVNFFGDIFRLLLDSYNVINKKDDKNPFDVLNSSEMLYQFIIFYISYISVENYDKFSELINGEVKRGGDGTDDEDDGSEIDMEEDREDSTKESSSPILSYQEKEYIGIPEYVYITHNNLLTTITRGMFIKLGIWKKIFFHDEDISSITPDRYVFGIDELNQITYETLIKIYPISPEEPGGHRNNELLILEILILKRLLVEMSPSKTLTFGTKIDDELKNYMDTFYFDYFIKNNRISYKPEEILDTNIVNNPNNETITPSDEADLEELFEMCDEGCDEYGEDYSAGSNSLMDGGDRQGNRNKIRKRKEKRLASIADIKEEEARGLINNKEGNTAPSVISEIEEVVIPDVPVPVSVPVPNKLDIDIVEQPKPSPMPILFSKLQKMYQNNMYIIKQLKNSKIVPIEEDGNLITTIYELLQLNETLMHKKGSTINIPAPKYKFVINNASNVGSNINGSKMFIPRSFLDSIKTIIEDIRKEVFVGSEVDEEKLGSYTKSVELQLGELYDNLKTEFDDEIKILNSKKRAKAITIREYNHLLQKKYEQKIFERTRIIPLENKLLLLEVLKENDDFYNEFNNNYNIWFRDSQPIFGLYRTLQRGIFCPTSSMMDAMDNCSLKYNTTEPKEVGTSYSEIKYENEDKNISFGGVVLNYNTSVQGNEQLVAQIYYTLVCNDPKNGQINDTVTISTLPIKVSESNDLKARVAYQGVINRIKELYDNPIPYEIPYGTVGDIEPIKRPKRQKQKDSILGPIKKMWVNLQYQYNPYNFNALLSATALKTMGDYLQECQACFKWGGYVSTSEQFPEEVNQMLVRENIQDKLIYRSVSKGNSIIPYDGKGNALRLGIQGDRPSGFRSIYMLLNGESDVNDQAITGYMFTSSTQNPSRTLLVSRNSVNMREPNSDGLKGNVIYVTRELQIPDKDSLLRSLEFLNVKTKQRKIDGVYVIPEIGDTTIQGSQEITGDRLFKNPMTKIQPFKNSAYEEWYNYETEFRPEEVQMEVEEEKTDAEEARDQRKNKFKQTKGLSPEEKKITKQQIKDAKIKINRLRDDLTEKQKEQTKIIPIIPLEILDRLRETAIREDISEEIFNLIHDEVEELDRAIKEFEAEEAEKKAKSAEKSAERSAKNEKIKIQIHEINTRIDELREERRSEITDFNNKIEDLQKQLEPIIGRKTISSILDRKNKELLDLKNKPLSAKYTEENKQTDIKIREDELDKINTIVSKITELTQQKNDLESPIREMENEIAELNAQLKSKKGGTKSNKKEYIHTITKPHTKKGNKLTKRHKKVKIPRKTRKNT